MEINDSFQTLLKKSETNLKNGTDQIRYELARQGLSKTPAGADLYLERSIDLLGDEVYKIINEIKAEIFKPKEWEPIRPVINQFIKAQCSLFADFLINGWSQPSSQVTNLLGLLQSSLKRETNTYIDRQKAKLSKGMQTVKDIIKIFLYGLAAGIVGFLIKFLLTR